MNKQKYEQGKHECWLDTANFCGFSSRDTIKHSAFDAAFDRAYALGKQEKDPDAVISGWVCRDKEWNKNIFTSDLFLAMEKPKRDEGMGIWYDLGKYIPLNTELFPDLTWDDDPLEVEIIIKRKKK